MQNSRSLKRPLIVYQKGYTLMVQCIVISNANEAMTVVPLLSSGDVLPFLEGRLRASFPPFVLFFPCLSELSEEEEEEILKAATVKIKIVLTLSWLPNFIAYSAKGLVKV